MGINHTKYAERIITECAFSKEMQTYLLSCDLSDSTLLDIILGAPIPISQKRDLIESMYTPDSKRISEISTCILEIDEALASLVMKDGDLFTLSECWYDKETLDERKAFAGPFLSFHAVINHVTNAVEEETKELKETEEYACWTEVIKWETYFEDMKAVYSYILVGNEIYYFKRIHENRRDSFNGYVSSVDLNLPIPFMAGDIITLNCLPFAPIKHAVIVEANDNTDCCGIQIMFRQKSKTNGKNAWATGALKHGHGWNSYYPLLSPIYRLSSITNESAAGEQLMVKIQQHVRNDTDNGRKLWTFIINTEPDDNAILEYLRKLT